MHVIIDMRKTPSKSREIGGHFIVAVEKSPGKVLDDEAAVDHQHLGKIFVGKQFEILRILYSGFWQAFQDSLNIPFEAILFASV